MHFPFAKYLLVLICTSCISYFFGQLQVSITIDDVPNTPVYQSEHYKSSLLTQLDSLNLPVAIFINEGKIGHTNAVNKNKKLLESWIEKPYVTLGNHTYSHARSSISDLQNYTHEVEKGEELTRKMADQVNKQLHHFRFPYNDLGADSLQQEALKNMLQERQYRISPFTVESSDWMFNAVYEHFLKLKNKEKAHEIGMLYVEKTLEFFLFFDSLSNANYDRSIRQIYLCHDNPLNAKYLSELVRRLNQLGCSFISLDEALKDPVYQQVNQYHKKWGVSWFYRWMKNPDERKKCMEKQPDMQEITTLYEHCKK